MNTLFLRRVCIVALCIIVAGTIGSPVRLSAQQQATNIHTAVLEGDYEAVQRFLDAGVSPDSYNSTGFAPLHSAVRAGRADIVGLLLKYDGDVDVQSRTAIDSAQAGLHIAARNGYRELIELLLENGADPNIQDSRGNTPLHDAAISGDRAITRTLVLGGADVGVRNAVGEDALAVASENLDSTVFSRNRIQLAVPITISPQFDFDDLSRDVVAAGLISGLRRTDVEVGFSALFPIGDSNVFIGPEVAVGIALASLFSDTLIIHVPLRLVTSFVLNANTSIDALIGAELNVVAGGTRLFTDLTFDVGVRLDVAGGLLFGAYYTLPFAIPLTPQFAFTDTSTGQTYTAGYWQNALSLVLGYRFKLSE